MAAELAVDSYQSGDWLEAAALLDAELEDESPFFMEPGLRGARARMHLAMGDVAGAAVNADRALELGRQSQDAQSLFPALADYAFCQLGLGEREKASLAAAELETLASESYVPHSWFLHLAFVDREVGRGEEVAALAGSLRMRTLWTDAALLFARDQLSAAADLLAEMGARPDEAYVRLKAGDEVNVRRALDFWRSVGATRYVREAESLLAASA
jgi:hypothetical protein